MRTERGTDAVDTPLSLGGCRSACDTSSAELSTRPANLASELLPEQQFQPFSSSYAQPGCPLLVKYEWTTAKFSHLSKEIPLNSCIMSEAVDLQSGIHFARQSRFGK
ncbi:unnamed protein product [Nippostrongylus brasiliensis]|uniref:Uncharacterized protein n=1 Tax=Nippostrongylus brasiliensis TaxID=27835 RepID=A0A0N4XHG3_NIPBR|nr:unnamed protein product [Nippostrongylus brasiliensis]